MTRIVIETEHDDPERVARSVSPDNTDEITTRVEEGKVVTVVERDDIPSARSTADDYVRNLTVADDVLGRL